MREMQHIFKKCHFSIAKKWINFSICSQASFFYKKPIIFNAFTQTRENKSGLVKTRKID